MPVILIELIYHAQISSTREKCAVQLPKLVDEYDDIHDVITELFQEMDQYSSDKVATITDWKQQYDVINKTLEVIGQYTKH